MGSITPPFVEVKRRLYTQPIGGPLTWVHDRIFAAGGDHIPRTWRSFADQTGIDAVLHMRPEHPAAFLGPPPAVFLWLDVEDESQVEMQERWLTGRFLETMLSQGRRVLLHSSLGRHRTRWVFVAFGIYSGRSVRAVLRQAAERPWLSPYHTDEAACQDFAEFVRNRRANMRFN